MVLNRIVSPARQALRDLRPPIPHDPVREEQAPLLHGAPLVFLDVGTEVVVPSLAALLAHSACMAKDVPGKFSAIMVHLCGPCLATRRIKNSSSCSVHARFRPASPHAYTSSRFTRCSRNPTGCACPGEDFRRVCLRCSTSIIINYCQTHSLHFIPKEKECFWLGL